MKKIIILFTVAFCLCTAVMAAEAPVITAQPEGAQVEIGADFSLAISAEVSDGGTLSYLWYSTRVNDISTIRAVIDGSGESAVFVPAQEEGVVYYCCMVTNTLDGESEFVYSELVPVVFTLPKVSELAVRVAAPEAGKAPDFTAEALSRGFTVEKVRWQPESDSFEAGKSYTVEVVLMPEAGFSIEPDTPASINGEPASVTVTPSGTFVLSRAFDLPAPATTTATVTTTAPTTASRPTEATPVSPAPERAFPWIPVLTGLCGLFAGALLAVILKRR